jgi:hypothetical protein
MQNLPGIHFGLNRKVILQARLDSYAKIRRLFRAQIGFVIL